jgi:hypothetical protein
VLVVSQVKFHLNNAGTLPNSTFCRSTGLFAGVGTIYSFYSA